MISNQSCCGYWRTGSTSAGETLRRQSHARIIAATTNRDLRTEIREGRFRLTSTTA